MTSEPTSITFGPNGETRVFEDVEQLRHYLASDDFLGWTKFVKPSDHNTRSHLDRLIAGVVRDLTELTYQGNLTYAAEQIARQMRERPFPTYGTPLSIWLIQLAERSPDRAAYALMALVNSPPSSFDFKCAQGASDLAIFQSGLSTETAEAGLVALDRLRKEQLLAISEVRSARKSHQKEFDATIAEMKKAEAESLSNRKEDHYRALQDFKEEVAKGLAELEATRQTYIQYMSLGAPVDYWTQKSQRHKVALDGTGYLPWEWGYEQRVPIFLVGIVAAAILYLSAALRWVYIPGDIERTIGITTVGALLTTVLLWYARIQTRQLMRHRHLYEDAEERRVMISSYLAMSVEGKVEKEDRVLALGAAFRAASDGISSDDGAPDISTAAIIGRLVQNGK